MIVSKQAKRDAKELFVSCQVNGVMAEDGVRAAVGQVLESRPRGYLGILAYFQRLVRFDIERRTARIESAAALPAEFQGTLRAALARIYGPDLYLTVEQNPALIGGLRIRVGSDVYDGSVRARLAALEEGFSQKG